MSRKRIGKHEDLITYRSFIVESDLGCILQIGKVLSDLLRQLHEAAQKQGLHLCAENRSLDPKLENRLAKGLLPDDFEDRLKLAFACKLISDGDYRDIEIFRRLRNEAAHEMFEFRLEDKGIRARVRQLSAAKRKNVSGSILSGDALPNVKRRVILNAFALSESLMSRIAEVVLGQKFQPLTEADYW